VPQAARGGCVTEQEHMRRCLVRQLLRWRVERNAEAIEAMRKSPGYEALKAEAERQWNAGNRGECGKWIE
jgi:hypothetical protein